MKGVKGMYVLAKGYTPTTNGRRVSFQCSSYASRMATFYGQAALSPLSGRFAESLPYKDIFTSTS